MLVSFGRTAKHGGSRSHDGVAAHRGHCRWLPLGACYRPGSTANVFRLSHTPPPRLPFPPTRGRLWLLLGQVTASLGCRWTRRSQRVPAPVARNYLFRFPVRSAEPLRISLSFRAPFPFCTPSRASPMSRSASLGPRRNCCGVILVVAPNSQTDQQTVRSTDACDTRRAIRDLGLRRGCRRATLSPDSKPAPNQPACAKTCPAELINQAFAALVP